MKQRTQKPIVELCWKRLPTEPQRYCDRARGHQGPHSWDLPLTADELVSILKEARRRIFPRP